MAGLQAKTSRLLCLLLLITTAAVMNGPAVVMAEDAPPSTLTVYFHENRVPPNATVVASASPLTENGVPAYVFGAIDVINDVVRETAGDSPILGYVVGQITVLQDFSTYLDLAIKLSSPGLMGTIQIQGTADTIGNGELAITGGTGMFRWARGYTELSLVNDSNQADAVFKSVSYLKYD